jgi:hypothetical protein
VFLHDVRVVQQPLAGRTYVDCTLRRVGQSIMNFMEYSTRVVETAEQRAVSSLPAWWKQPMLTSNVPRMSRKAIRSEYFTADRANEFSISVVVLETEKSENPVLGFLRRNYGRCHRILSSQITARQRAARSSGPLRMNVPVE